MELNVSENIGTKGATQYSCPNCLESNISLFYRAEHVPVHSVLLLNTREEALNYPKGTIELGFCKSCGFIYNTKFDPSLHEYYSEYESSQAFSSTFNSFSKQLAGHLIDRHGLRGKDIIEIGCGQGEFIRLLCGMGDNRGIGFDPAYSESRSSEIQIGSDGSNADVSFIKDFYTEKYGDYNADFICCKMTLEHIQDTAGFIKTLRLAIGSSNKTGVFFQIPEASRVLDDTAFWDIYYEHCSYFSPISLAKLFTSNGFDVTDIWTDYDDQYLMIEAHPGKGEIRFEFDEDQQLNLIESKVDSFKMNLPGKLEYWNENLKAMEEKGHKAVVWGSSSKGVAFLTTLGAGYEQIEYVVDINTYRQGSFMAGTGQKIVSPDFLKVYEPDVVIVMNPIYIEEIRNQLIQMGLSPEIVSV